MADTTLNTYLFDLAKEILAECVDILTDAGITPPEIRAVRQGVFRDEGCDQLDVSLQRLYSGLPSDPSLAAERQAALAWSRSVSFAIRTVRCVNTSDNRGNPPSVTEIEADASDAYSDIWVLHQGLVTRYHASSFLETCQELVIGDAVPADADGAIDGWTITLDMAVS